MKYRAYQVRSVLLGDVRGLNSNSYIKIEGPNLIMNQNYTVNLRLRKTLHMRDPILDARVVLINN